MSSAYSPLLSHSAYHSAPALATDFGGSRQFYAKKASQKKSEPIVAIAWILSVIFLISAFTAPVMLIFSMIGCLFAIGLRVYRKKMYKKYQPMVLFYAAEVVKYEDKINLYNTLISKLTK